MHRCLLFPLVTLLMAAPAWAQAPLKPQAAEADPAVARVGERLIRESEFREFLEETVPPGELAGVITTPAKRSLSLEAYVDNVVLEMKARKDGFAQHPMFLKAMEMMEMKQLMQFYMIREKDRMPKVEAATEAEVRADYDGNPDAFKIPPHFTARQILVLQKGNPAHPEKGLDEAKAQARAQEALGRLKGGESWEKVAQAYSDDEGTSKRGGLIQDGQFGYFPPEMEQAVRGQELGKPGDPVKSPFGYQIIQVEAREGKDTREAFEKVKDFISQRLTDQKRAAAYQVFLEPIRKEMGLKTTPSATREPTLRDAKEAKEDELLAVLGSQAIMETDFQWFFKDAFRAEQRVEVLNRPGARRELVASYLDMRVLAAKARKEGVDKDKAYLRARAQMEANLLTEFLQERDHKNIWQLPGNTEEEKMTTQLAYLKELRSEMGAKILDNPAGTK